MNNLDKARILFTVKNSPYDEKADKVINLLIDKGELVKFEYGCVVISCKCALYYVWIENRYYADLSWVSMVKNNVRKHVYEHVRPSRKTQIRFWEWIEKICPSYPDIYAKSDNLENTIKELEGN